jgi:hypothetical protein
MSHTAPDHRQEFDLGGGSIGGGGGDGGAGVAVADNSEAAKWKTEASKKPTGENANFLEHIVFECELPGVY